MTSTPDVPDGADLEEVRAEIDELKATPTDELISPSPADLGEDDTEVSDPEPEPTDPIG
ncbi:hypothetical protein [Microbacterium terricola]|uniref:Uncharacterized protein n=1 Tax=Microbacterium terricola TaxID=344163 RepID=A0ABM8DZE3_9MICO|nr:hypothetical protein [Microbacterium terricola]UYK41190.1 hypothetical protein OAU46_06010 [Microbacterium terricola]BDV31037.1 hypothetical protein Microterr_16970 [Microbacterium terricola]